MNTEFRKKKLFKLIPVIAALAMTAICFAMLMYGNSSISADAASSGSIVDYNTTAYVSLNLDVNGQTGTTQAESSADFAANNSSNKGFKKRYISITNFYGTHTAEEMEGYYLRADSVKRIYNYNTEYVTVETPDASSDGTINYYSYLIITANRSTDNLVEAAYPRFALVLTNGTDDIVLTVRVQITAKFSPSEYDTSSGGIYYVGRQLNAGSNGLLDSGDRAYRDLPLKLTNYQTIEISLEDYFEGRKLYASDTANTNISLPKDRNFTDQNAERTNRVLMEQNTSNYLSVRDITSFHIKSEPSIGTLITSSNVRFFTDNANDRRSFTVSLNITSKDLNNIGNYDPKTEKLWEGDGAYFELSIDLVHNKSNEEYTIKIPVVFVPASAPKRNAEFGMATSLNAGSDYTFPESGTYSSVGFKTVKVTPEYLCDYVSYDVNNMYFTDVAPTPETDGVVEVTVPERGEGEPVYYNVTAIGNGNTDVVFSVNYRYDNSYRTLEIPVTFTVYGSYSVVFDIKGTSVHEYNINSSLFEALKNDGYQIVNAAPLKFGEEVVDSYAHVSYSNGTITITPVQSLSYSDIVGVSVTLVDIEGHRIELDCGMTINMKANDPFGTWLTWQKVLFWIGIGLAVALLILLIVWLFIRSMHKRRIDELEVSAPTSAYIIKLNSTIAAAQAQQKGAAAQRFSTAQTQQMMLSSPAPAPIPPNTMPPMPNALPNALPNTGPNGPEGTLALGVTPQTSTPAYSSGMSTGYVPTGDMPSSSSYNDDIYIPVSDEELLQRIYEEKFEPRGMLKRTFDKSKDLQQRELEKEKERIREDVRNGMSIEEACKSVKQRETYAATTGMTGDRTVDSQPVMQLDPLIMLLGFDPADPVVSDVKPEPEQEDWSDEVKKLKSAEYNNQRLHAELSIIESRLEAIAAANTKTESDVESAHTIVDNLTNELHSIEQNLDDKNMALATERRKSAKEALSKEIADLDSRVKADKDAIAARRGDIESYTGILAKLKEIGEDYSGKKEVTEALVSSSDQELAAAQAEVKRIEDLAERARKQAELNAKLEILTPMLLTVNTLDDEIRELNYSIERSTEQKDSLKTKVGALQTEMLSATDSAKINELNIEIRNLNKEISDVDRGATANTTLKTNKNIEMTAARRKANEFIEKEEIEVEDVIRAEDKIIGQLALDKLRAKTEADKVKAEEAVARWQSECDSLVDNLDNMVMEAVAGVAAKVKETEDALADAQAKLAEIDSAIEVCDSDDDRLNLTMEQMSLQEEIATLTESVETMRADGIKANLEFRQKGEDEIDNAREELSKAKADFESATARFDDVSTNVNPLDLITSGSGVISMDRKKYEAENLKKLLKESQNAAEQAKIQAQLAQEEAERAVADARRASDESKAESERLAQEAVQKAEAAREEAEQRAREEAERARQEAEEVKRLAQEEVENARRLAEEESERMRREAEEESERMKLEMEEHKRLAEEEAERARKEAEEEAERARKEAEEAAKQAEEESERMKLEMEEQKRLAEEEAERARKEAEEEAERTRKEAEEAAKHAEEEAAKQAEEEAKRKARIDEKVAKKKEEITKLRDELKNITEEEQGAALREKFYQMQLGLDEDEKTSQELNDLLAKSMDDASHAAELSRYKKLANQKPRRVVKKVTERVNRVPKKKAGANGRRPAQGGARRPNSASRGARPAQGGARRPSSASRGARPSQGGARRPSNGVRRPSGSRPSTKK